ncbi:uncharacterized protein RAG0_15400 [Rhynchosporium agropyri]|uniref:GATA-type domain-containing protein n=1 Tax=Rhynchosporium agropyri TaxID=914238 RepID=A0A1E1LKZ2_9HELO|nr:uncharacterized protein RAG0_15400 [Rhynchosporium agropyri]
MAATAVASPSMYSHPPPPYSWGGPGPSIMSMISPPDSRRTSDGKTEPPPAVQASHLHRYSLPSIHEALAGGPKPSSFTSPIIAPAQHSQQMPYTHPQGPQVIRPHPSERLPYPAPQPTIQRQPSSPQPVHPQSIPFARPEQGPPNTYSEHPRHGSLTSLQTAPAPPNPYASRSEERRCEQDPRAQERAPNGYQQPPLQPPHNYGPGPSPFQSGPPPMFQPPQFPPQNREMKDWLPQEKQEREPLRQSLKRNLEVWNFEDRLARINGNSTAIQMWSAHYNAIAQEQQQVTNIIPDRMPTLDSVNEMLRCNEEMTGYLSEMKAIIYEQAQHTANQRMREQGGRGAGDYDEEGWNDDMKSNGGYGEGNKKRRGRAAPPGRCHSCNRAETPEWRRGPDGARTLCNACGLHYAKLTRKNTMKNSQGSTGAGANGDPSGGIGGNSLRPLSKDGLEGRM